PLAAFFWNNGSLLHFLVIVRSPLCPITHRPKIFRMIFLEPMDDSIVELSYLNSLI
ncbi:unnamed protein product, partial [Caenorhabditis auriculariae]